MVKKEITTTKLQKDISYRDPVETRARFKNPSHPTLFMMASDQANWARIFSTSDFRVLNSVEKGVKLVMDNNCSLRCAAILCKLSRGALTRACKATKKNREPGLNGRPKALSAAEKDNVIEILAGERDNVVKVDYKEGKV